MNYTIIKSDSRGRADFGWLKARYSFSFANYYDPERVHFGVLRVLNDDIIDGGSGFDTHPHDNMEIITIPLEGDLSHADSMGNSSIIRQGDIQVMSAGTGIRHSEHNANSDRELRLLQIWLFPREKGLTPRYDQKRIRDLGGENTLFTVLSPDPEGEAVWIHQDAWFSMGYFTKSTQTAYKLKRSDNGVYIFIIKGEVQVSGHTLGERDALTIEGVDIIDLSFTAGSEVLIMDIPMSI